MSDIVDLERAAQLEWLETNGLGGFASSTVAGLNTRRYHGLLVPAINPPVGRMVALSRFEETVELDGRRLELSANRYPGVVHPRGYEYLQRFDPEPFPTFVYRAAGVEIRRTVFMPHGENTTVVEYEADAEIDFELRPLIAFRDYHSLTHRNGALNPELVQSSGLAIVKPYADLPPLYIAHDADAVETSGYWYENHEYDREIERGLDFREDLFNPCVLRFPRRRRFAIIVSLGPHSAADAAGLREAEARRRRSVAARAPVDDPLVRRLTAAADQFVVRRGELHTIVAGYHWFSDWGRDTMIALPGIALVTGRFDVARDILLAFARSVDRGMLPNRFPDQGEQPEYNTVDATLWFFEAVRAYVEYTGDRAFAAGTLYPCLRDILEWHLRGTRYGIHVDRDGLLECGVPGVQLTWMDSKIGDWVVTPRHGKPVEIQALWHNALRIAASIAAWAGDAVREEFLLDLAVTAQSSFNRTFWNEERGCLYDCIQDGRPDPSIRPNQIFAVSLANPLVTDERAARVVEVVRRTLLTPMGLRSLAPGEPGYRPTYEGGVYDRDSAYHQGTVWPWLIGPFISAYVKVHGHSPASRTQAADWLRSLTDHMNDACVGQVSEIADAEWPHTPRGCVAQAWSVSELLRAAVQDVHNVRPVAASAAIAS